jgi:DNA-binding response OmpR family regulator
MVSISGLFLGMGKNTILSADLAAGAALPLPACPTHRILVVDDDPYFCHRNAEVLIRHGYEVNAVEDGALGWQELQANRYHLLITENELPKLTGMELIQKLRSARMTLPVIFATDKSPKLAVARRLRLNPVVTLLKPYTLTEFIETVKVALVKAGVFPFHPAPPQTIGDPFNSVRLAERAAGLMSAWVG